MTALFLAVDGGQSATIAILGTAEGMIRGVGRGGPLRHHANPDAAADAKRAINAAVGEAITGLGPGERVTCCCLALTGSEAFVEAAVRALVPAAHVLVLVNDALAALASGRVGLGGVGLIAGTGSVAVAVGRSGGPLQVGGWGWVLGDEGGGFWLGLEGLRAAARAVDGTGPGTFLSDSLPAHLGADDMRLVRDSLTGGLPDRVRIAGLAETIVASADDGDTVAADLVDQTVKRLSTLALRALDAGAFLEPDERVVVPAGGLLRRDGRILERLRVCLAELAPGVGFVVPDVPPVAGAFVLALRDHGVDITEEVSGALRRESLAHELDRKVGMRHAPVPGP